MGRHRTPQEKLELGDRARSLRAEGRSRREIAAELHVGDDLLTELLAGTAVPQSLRRPRAKDDVRQRARELREAGWTYPQIAKELSVSRSTCSLWLRDLDHPEPTLEGQARRTAALRASGARRRSVNEASAARFKEAIAQSLGAVTSRDLLIALAVSYWCEGGKSKPWSRRERLVWVNSDPTLVRLFLDGLALLDVSPMQLRFELQIHESADEFAARRWWAEQIGIAADDFGRTTLKRHNPKTLRRNSGSDYHGCLRIRVLQSRALYHVMDGLVQGLAGQPRAVVALADVAS